MLLLALATHTYTLQAESLPITPKTDKDSIILSYTADEVVIQTFKRNDNLSQLPVSATLVSDKTIKNRNITNIKEISSFIPNLFIPDYGSKKISPVYIRGIGSQKDAPSVGLYVDGVPYFDRSSFDIGSNDIERIEVLRGPQGTIYGRNTMGGIINVYTKSPFKYKETNIGLSAGNYNTYDLKASHYGNIKNKFGYSLSGGYRHTGGYFNNIYTHKKADPMDAVSGRLRLSWRAAHNLYLHLTSAYEYSDQDGYAYGVYNDTTNTVSDVDYNRHSYYRRNMSTTGLNIQYSTDNMRFFSQSSYQYFDGKQGLDQDFTPIDAYYVLFKERQNMFSQEFNLKSLGNRKYEWLFGAFGFYQDYSTYNDISYIINNNLKKYQDVSTPTTGFALFHQSKFNDILTPGLSATLGIRYDWEQIKSHPVIWDEKKPGIVSNKTDKRDRNTYSQLSPKVSLQYTFTNDEMVYASVAKGYKAGGFNNTAAEGKYFTFDPEQSWSYEIGTKASCLNKLIYTEISLFYIDWRDQQISQYQLEGGHGFIIRNAGKSTSKGVEATVNVNPTQNLSFILSYGYTDAKFKTYVKDSVTNYSGKYLPMVPRHTFSAAANYTINMKKNEWLDKIVLNGQYTGLGKLFWREDNIAYQPFYGIINAQATFVKKNLSVDLWAKNIGKEKYIAYYFLSQYGSYAQKGKPFTCGVNVNFTF